MKWDYVIEAIGIVGAIEILLAYALNIYKKIRSDAFSFYLLNFTGGILLAFYTYYKEAWSSLFINIVWVIIAVIHIIRFFQKKNIQQTHL
jgi:hypothetical protein